MREYMLWEDIELRAVIFGNYIVENNSSIRRCARHFGVSKSVVHTDVSKRLKTINPSLYKEVKAILDHNLSVWNITGGEATRRKWELIRLSKK